MNKKISVVPLIGFLVALFSALFVVHFATAQALNGAFGRHFFSAASNNSTLVRAGVTVLDGVVVINQGAAAYYLKFYDKATAPTCGTDTPIWTVPVLNTGGPVVVMPSNGVQTINGLGFCITGAAADNDNTNAGTGVTLDVLVR